MTIGSERNRQAFVSFNDSKDKLNTASIAKLIILKLLIDKNYYGNELIDEIEKQVGYLWRPSPGMIYPQLRYMEENEWIASWWDSPYKKSKRYYKITDEGVKYYSRIKNIYYPQLAQSKNIIEKVINIVYKK